MHLHARPVVRSPRGRDVTRFPVQGVLLTILARRNPLGFPKQDSQVWPGSQQEEEPRCVPGPNSLEKPSRDLLCCR